MESKQKVGEAEKIVMEVMRRRIGDDVAETTLSRFVMSEVKPYAEKRSDFPGFSDVVWSKAIESLRHNYQISLNTVFGIDRTSIEFHAISPDAELLENYAEKKLGEYIEEVEKEYEFVNGHFKTMEEARKSIEQSDLPNYGSSGVRDLAEFYLREASNLVSGILPFKVGMPDFKIMEGGTAYQGKSRGVHEIRIGGNVRKRPVYYEKPEGEVELDYIVDLIENCPTAAMDKDSVEVPARAPEILAVDLLHECGHLMANQIIESEISGEKDNYGPADHSLAGKKGLNTEKAANEIAVYVIERMKRDSPVFQPVDVGLKSYIELSRFDNPADGYRDQFPIDGSRESLRNIFL